MNLLERIAARAAKNGSKAKTLRGQLKSQCNFSGRLIALPPEPCETWQPRAERFTVEERELRRAATDAKFRAAIVRRLRAEIVKIDNGPPSLAAAEARNALADRVAAISPKSQIPARKWGLLPSLTQAQAENLGARVYTRGTCYIWSGYTSSYTYFPRAVGWENGKKWRVTTSYAKSRNTILSVGVLRPDGTLAWQYHDRAGVAQPPAGCKFAVIAKRWHVITAANNVAVALDVDALLRDQFQARSVLMPAELAARFGAYEFGEDAETEIERKRGIVAQEIERKREIVTSEIARKRENAASERQAKRDSRAVRLLARLLTLPVSCERARRSGACLAGITAWAQARGIDLLETVPVRVLSRDSDAQARRIASEVSAEFWRARKAS
jgi:hypothetical protein